jgi:hypothetical protein
LARPQGFAPEVVMSFTTGLVMLALAVAMLIADGPF